MDAKQHHRGRTNRAWVILGGIVGETRLGSCEVLEARKAPPTDFPIGWVAITPPSPEGRGTRGSNSRPRCPVDEIRWRIAPV